jgi:hypothetical protein
MGQSKNKQRMCPAVGRGISAAECGENRVSQYQCPAECPYNPWSLSAYDQVLAIETAFFDRLRRYAASDPVTCGMRIGDDPTDIAAQYRNLRAWFLHRDREGLTLIDRWERAGFTGLNNDQRVLARCHARVRLVVGETLDHLSADAVRVQDRLDLAASPIVLQDRAFAKRAGRFARFIPWVFPLPHYSRVTASAISVPDIGSLEAEEIVGAVAEHLRGPSAGEPLREWLTANYVAVFEAFESVNEGIRRKSFEKVVYTKLFYRLAGPSEAFTEVMAGAPEAVSNAPNETERKEGFTHEWAWLDLAEESLRKAVGGGRPTLGRVLFGSGMVRLEGGGEDRACRMQESFEGRVGRTVAFESRRVDDVGRQMIARDARPFDPALVPPCLLDHAPHFETSVQLVDTRATVSADDLMRDQRRKWLDEPVPLLAGKTPRQAASDPVLRPKLISLVKEVIRRADRVGLEKGSFEDEGWMAAELGLAELDLPLPSRLAELREQGGAGQRPHFEEDEPELEDESDDGSCDDPVDDFCAECPELEEWLGRVTGPLEEHEYERILGLVATAWSLASNHGEREMNPNIDRLDHQFKTLVRTTVSSSTGDKDDRLKALMPPPEDEMASLLCLLLFSESELAEPPPPDPLCQNAMILGMFILRAVSQEFDRAKREG